MKNLFAIIGGDQRQRHLAHLLRDDGHTVLTACLGGGDDVPLKEAAGAACVILPLPVSRDGINLHTNGAADGALSPAPRRGPGALRRKHRRGSAGDLRHAGPHPFGLL